MGILSANTASKVESSANGMTFFGSVVSAVMVIIFVWTICYWRQVYTQILGTNQILVFKGN